MFTEQKMIALAQYLKHIGKLPVESPNVVDAEQSEADENCFFMPDNSEYKILTNTEAINEAEEWVEKSLHKLPADFIRRECDLGPGAEECIAYLQKEFGEEYYSFIYELIRRSTDICSFIYTAVEEFGRCRFIPYVSDEGYAVVVGHEVIFVYEVK